MKARSGKMWINWKVRTRERVRIHAQAIELYAVCYVRTTSLALNS